jgi:type IV fimbrial biogenesis protein FimT
MALFTMPRMGLDNAIMTTETDSYSRVPMVFHPSTRSNSRSQGFTLIELLVTLAILAIVAVIAAPSLQNFVLNNRIRSQAAALTTSLVLARTEAINRSTRVVTCPGTASGCTETPWEDGWLVFVDTNNNAVLDEEETQLELHVALDGNNTLRGTTDVTNYVSFDYDGRAQKVNGDAQSGTFILCDQRGFGDHARAIDVIATGRSRNLIATDSSQNSCKPSP